MDENKEKKQDLPKAQDDQPPFADPFFEDDEEDEIPLRDRVMIVVRRIALVVAIISLVIGTALMIFSAYFGQTRFLKNLPKFVNYILTSGVKRTNARPKFDSSLLGENQVQNPDLPKFKEDAEKMAYYRDGLLDDNFLELIYIELGAATYRRLSTVADLGVLSDASFNVVCGIDIVTAAARYIGVSVSAEDAQFADGLTPRRRAELTDVALHALPAPTAVPDETADSLTEEPIPDETADVLTEEPIPDETADALAEEPTPDETAEVFAEEPIPEETADALAEGPIPDETADVLTEEPIPDETADTLAEEPIPDETADTLAEISAEE